MSGKIKILPEKRRWLGLRKRKYRLGRHVRFDERSLAFRVGPPELTLVSKIWERALPPLQQGQVGSCTGNGCVGVLATSPVSMDGIADNIEFCEALAVKIYTRASEIDNFEGKYPEQDTGSSVLSAMQAAKEFGLISGYQWCLGTEDVLQTLSHVGPVEVGFMWTSGFDQPDSTGLVRLGGKNQGGHAFELIGLDVEREVVWAVNSWGSGWGANGRFCFSFEDLRTLMKNQGEAVRVIAGASK